LLSALLSPLLCPLASLRFGDGLLAFLAGDVDFFGDLARLLRAALGVATGVSTLDTSPDAKSAATLVSLFLRVFATRLLAAVFAGDALEARPLPFLGVSTTSTGTSRPLISLFFCSCYLVDRLGVSGIFKNKQKLSEAGKSNSNCFHVALLGKSRQR
jgi:hypothetical protein